MRKSVTAVAILILLAGGAGGGIRAQSGSRELAIEPVWKISLTVIWMP
jgi:hypothetical protein